MQRDEAAAVGGAQTGASVEGRLVSDGELAKILADHVGLHLNDDVSAAVVDVDDVADHLGEHDHVTQVGAHGLGLVQHVTLTLLQQCKVQLKHKKHRYRLNVQTCAASSSGSDAGGRWWHGGSDGECEKAA